MSRNTKDYSQGKIYCIRNSINDDIYIGSTCQSLSRRMSQHRSNLKHGNIGGVKLYKKMNELGREHFYIELLEEYPCENVIQLTKREGELIREHQSTLNSIINGRTKKEYYEENKQKFKEYYEQNRDKKLEQVRKHYEQNKDAKLKYAKHYRNENKEKIQDKIKIYYDENKEDIKQQKKEYYQNNKEREQARAREYQNNNREKVRESNRQYYARKKNK